MHRGDMCEVLATLLQISPRAGSLLSQSRRDKPRRSLATSRDKDIEQVSMQKYRLSGSSAAQIRYPGASRKVAPPAKVTSPVPATSPHPFPQQTSAWMRRKTKSLPRAQRAREVPRGPSPGQPSLRLRGITPSPSPGGRDCPVPAS